MTQGRFLLDEPGLESLGRSMAPLLAPEGRVFLVGELGSGKTTLARAVIRALGVEGAIPSPSYILDAVYTLPGIEIHHMDLYRLSGDPREIAMLGFDEILDSPSVVIVEWADRFPDLLGMPGYHVCLRSVSNPSLREVFVERLVAGN